MFKEIFYLFYQLEKGRKNDSEGFNPIVIVTVVEIFNIAAIIVVIKHLIGVIKIPLALTYVYIFGTILFLLLMYLNYIFIYKKRDQIFERHKNRSKSQELRSVLMTIVYFLFSFFLPMVLSDRWEKTKTEEVQQIDDVMSLQVVYDQFLKTNDYKYMREYYNGINVLIKNNPDQNGLIQIRDSLEKHYGDSLYIIHN